MDLYYEQERTLHEYLAFHYPDGDFLARLLGPATPPPAARFPLVLRECWTPRPDGDALDVGCACGRMTFELARDHRRAIGLDLARMLVRGAVDVRRAGRARYRTVREGDLTEEHDVPVETAANTTFLVGSALDLPFPDASFDTVLALNLVDRVPDPARALDELARVVRPGGRILLTSPFTWLDAFTPPDKRLGGFRRNGEPVRGIESVRARFANGFAIEAERRLPFFIPHHARSGQLGVTCLIQLRRDT